MHKIVHEGQFNSQTPEPAALGNVTMNCPDFVPCIGQTLHWSLSTCWGWLGERKKKRKKKKSIKLSPTVKKKTKPNQNPNRFSSVSAAHKSIGKSSTFMLEQGNGHEHRHRVNIAAAASCCISWNLPLTATGCHQPLGDTASVHLLPLWHTPSLLPQDCPACTEAVPATRRQHTPEQEPCTQPLPWKPVFLVKPSCCHLLCFLEDWRETRKWSAGLNPWFALGNNCTWSQGAEVPEVNSISERIQKQSCKIY